jgi:hypothetical protein
MGFCKYYQYTGAKINTIHKAAYQCPTFLYFRRMEPDNQEFDKPEATNEEPANSSYKPEPVVINPFHFTLLWLATLGIYAIWWQYKCWKYFSEVEEEDRWPGVRAVLFLFFGMELFEKIKLYCLEYESEVSYNSFVIWLTVIAVNVVARLPSPYFWISILGFIPFLFPVRELNFYFTGNKNGYVDDKLNDRQVLLLFLGVIFWMMIIASILMGNDPGAANA